MLSTSNVLCHFYSDLKKNFELQRTSQLGNTEIWTHMVNNKGVNDTIIKTRQWNSSKNEILRIALFCGENLKTNISKIYSLSCKKCSNDWKTTLTIHWLQIWPLLLCLFNPNLYNPQFGFYFGSAFEIGKRLLLNESALLELRIPFIESCFCLVEKVYLSPSYICHLKPYCKDLVARETNQISKRK